MSEAARILSAIENGDRQAAEQLLPLVYDELRRIARRYLRRERPDHTLQSAALVNEAYLRLAHHEALQSQDRAHFLVSRPKSCGTSW